MKHSVLFSLAVFFAGTTQAVTPQWAGVVDAPRLADQGHSVDETGGVIVHTWRRAVALTPDGAFRWSYEPPAGGETLATALLPDGSGWLLVRHGSGAHAVVRVAANGTSSSTDILPGVTNPILIDHALIADASQAVVLSASPDALDWVRVSAAGVVVESRRHLLPVVRERSYIDVTKRQSDGGVSASVLQRTPDSCAVSPPVNCRYARTVVLRLGPDGGERWRADLGETSPRPQVFFEDDGTSVIMTAPMTGDLSIATLAPDGTPGTAVTAPDTANAIIVPTSGPVGGRYLVALDMSDLDAARYAMIDRTGTRLASLDARWTGYGLPFTGGSRGFLVANPINEATLLSIDDLAPLQHYDVDGLDTPISWYRVPWWRMLPDGSIYTTMTLEQQGRVSRFAAPGSPADDRIFAGTFDMH